MCGGWDECSDWFLVNHKKTIPDSGYTLLLPKTVNSDIFQALNGSERNLWKIGEGNILLNLMRLRRMLEFGPYDANAGLNNAGAVTVHNNVQIASQNVVAT